jgi:TRAP-type C4-dicarboxylate transport system substrate-binding protein
MAAINAWTRRAVLVAGLALAVTSSGIAAAREKFILAHAFVTDHIVHPVAVRFAERLKERSNGAMTVDYHPGGDLGDYIQQFEQTMQGGIPMTMAGLATDFDARLNVGYLAYVVDDWKSARKLYGPGGPMVEILDRVLGDLKLKFVGTIPGGFGSIAVRKGVAARPTSFPEEAKGFKMRVPPFEIGVRRFGAWGFSPVPIPYSELFTALQLGTVDGRSFGPPQEIWEMRDTIGAYILTRDYFDVAFWVANKDWWNKLTAEQRGWVEVAAADAIAWGWDEGERRERENLDRIRQYGIEIVELTDEELRKAKVIVYEKEWPWMVSVVGEKLMNDVRRAAGVSQ